jgi:hypothetical protein
MKNEATMPAEAMAVPITMPRSVPKDRRGGSGGNVA